MDDPAFVLKAGSPVFGRTFSWPDGAGRPEYRVDPRPVNYAQALSGRGYRGPVGPPGGHIQIPALRVDLPAVAPPDAVADARIAAWVWAPEDRKSTRLNSSHVKISYAVFCLKKK